nr:uncharacterized protein LOC128687502 [Cherax quadricarinatus]
MFSTSIKGRYDWNSDTVTVTTHKVKYEISANGTKTADSDDPLVEDAEDELKKCRAAVSHIGEEVEKSLQETQKILTDTTESIKNLQDHFSVQQSMFQKSIEDFTKKVHEQQLRIVNMLDDHQKQLLKQHKTFGNIFSLAAASLFQRPL